RHAPAAAKAASLAVARRANKRLMGQHLTLSTRLRRTPSRPLLGGRKALLKKIGMAARRALGLRPTQLFHIIVTGVTAWKGHFFGGMSMAGVVAQLRFRTRALVALLGVFCSICALSAYASESTDAKRAKVEAAMQRATR